MGNFIWRKQFSNFNKKLDAIIIVKNVPLSNIHWLNNIMSQGKGNSKIVTKEALVILFVYKSSVADYQCLQVRCASETALRYSQTRKHYQYSAQKIFYPVPLLDKNPVIGLPL